MITYAEKFDDDGWIELSAAAANVIAWLKLRRSEAGGAGNDVGAPPALPGKVAADAITEGDREAPAASRVELAASTERNSQSV